MDFDLNAALNDYQAYTCALEARPTPAASAPPPPQPPSAAWVNSSAKRPTTYQDLPSEVIARIGDYVPVQDVMSFATVDQRFVPRYKPVLCTRDFCGEKQLGIPQQGRLM
jgi:outer membrane receptor protein involved in Fe transport